MTSNLTTRVTALESDVAEIKAGVSAILAALSTEQPAKPAARKTTARKAPARKPATRKAPAKKAQPKAAPAANVQVKALCKATRVAFVAAAKAQGLADFSGMSTKVIAMMCLEDASIVPAGFRIGEGYTALLG